MSDNSYGDDATRTPQPIFNQHARVVANWFADKNIVRDHLGHELYATTYDRAKELCRHVWRYALL